jgi:predicted nucleotide-binding protein
LYTNFRCHDGVGNRIEKHRTDREAVLIVFGYQWKGNESLFHSVSEAVESVISSLSASKGKKYHYKVKFKRLAATGDGGVLCKICEEIQKAEIAIFDISDNNVNVAFELGLALGTGTKTIILRNEKRRDVHFSDLAGMAENRFLKTRRGIRFINRDFANSIRGSIVTARRIKEKI